MSLREYESIYKELLNGYTAGGNRNKLGFKPVIKLSDLMKKATELSINNAPPDCITELKNLAKVIRIIIDNLNTNPLRNKFDELK